MAAAGGSGALTVRAHLGTADGNLLIEAKDCLLKLESKVVAEIASALNARATATATHVEHFAEDVAEDVADIALEASLEGIAASGSAGEGGVSIAIVCGALFRVAQDGVGLRALLELGFRLGIVRVPIRVVLHGETPVGGLQFLVGSSFADLQHVVKVEFRHVRRRHLS